MKGSKKSRNTNQTEKKGKNESRNQLSFAEESRLHENANLIFSSRKPTYKQANTFRKSNLTTLTNSAVPPLPSKKKSKNGGGGKSKSKTRKSKSKKRLTQVELNPDDSLNFEEDPHVANIMLPNARKLAPTHDFLDLPKIPPRLEDSMQNSIQSLTNDFLDRPSSRTSKLAFNRSPTDSRSP